MAFAAAATSVLVAGSHPAAAVEYDPPVDAPVTDPFRPPPQPWLPGNRGIEYATVPGTVVHAAADGQVTFAGQVGGTLHVTLQHADGIRTSYSYLASTLVVRGATVARGHPLGTTGTRFHVGARRGETYIDPASLWGPTGPPWVRLVPLGATPSPSRRRGAARLVDRTGWRPRLFRRPWHQVRVDLTPHSPDRQRSPPSGVRSG